MDIILGLNFGHPDSSACLVIEGVLVGAVSEERFGDRIKNTSKFPSNSIKWLLESNNIQPKDINYYEFDFLICRNVLPHMGMKEIESLIDISISKSKTKPYYIVHTYSSDKHRDDYILWDKTHTTIMNSHHWRKFFKQYKDNLYFSIDCLF